MNKIASSSYVCAINIFTCKWFNLEGRVCVAGRRGIKHWRVGRRVDFVLNLEASSRLCFVGGHGVHMFCRAKVLSRVLQAKQPAGCMYVAV